MKFKVSVITKKGKIHEYPFIRNIKTDGENIELYDRFMYCNRHKCRNVEKMNVEVVPYFD